MHILRFLPSTPSLDATAIVDILVVAFLVYQCLMVVRGTRAGPILLGIVIMISLYAISLWAGLEATRTLLTLIVPFIGLAVIVLFQSEIRRTLARLGRKRWLMLGGGFRIPDMGEVVLAIEQFSQQKTGCLIVLERDIGLRTFIESGVRLDARLSRDLLMSIFTPGLPLHDGAVIVQKERVAAAACFLPLTLNPQLSRQFGTRHRAAIGITEETDCLSLVVSEETGRISIAAFGELSAGLSATEVVERINHHFGVEKPRAAAIDEFTADIPLSPPAAPSENRSERVNQP
jgi:diadenylate cyclase